MRTPAKLTMLMLALLLGTAAALTGTSAAALPRAQGPDPLIAELVNQVDSAVLLGYVADLSGERPISVGGEEHTFETRYSYSEGIEKAMQYLSEHYRALGLDVAFHDYVHEENIWRNVEATLPGISHPERIYIICAHADSTSRAPMFDAPGADDNGSGTAAVMLAADILGQYQFENTIRFVNFSGEEQGLQGSAAYAARARASGEEIAGVINLDMIGWDATGGPDIDLHAGTDLKSISLAQTFSDTVVLYDLNLLPEILDDEAIGASDHSSFWDNGYAAVLAIEDYYPLRPDFNPHYHTGQDLLEHMNLDYFTTFTQAALVTLATLAVPAIPVPVATASATPTPVLPSFPVFLPLAFVPEWSQR